MPAPDNPGGLNEETEYKYILNELTSRDKHCAFVMMLLKWFYLKLPAQRSEEWKNARKFVVGGSEITNIMSARAITISAIKKKTGETRFEGHMITRWGNLFESRVPIIINNYIKKNNPKSPGIFMIETGSIPGMRDKNSGEIIQSYSPDGISLMRSSDIVFLLTTPGNMRVSSEFHSQDREIITKLRENNNSQLVLFEIKCPYSRKITGDIYKSYIHQPNLGMCTMPFLKLYLYIEACFNINPGNINECPGVYSGFIGLKSEKLRQSVRRIVDTKEQILGFALRALHENNAEIGYFDDYQSMVDWCKNTNYVWLQWYLETLCVVPGVANYALQDSYYKKINAFITEARAYENSKEFPDEISNKLEELVIENSITGFGGDSGIPI